MNYELIDAHAHLGYEPLLGDIDNVLARSTSAGVTGWITIGTGREDNEKAVALAQKYSGMYAGIGYHPHYAKDVTPADLDHLRKLAKSPKVVGIGETGLDFHYNFSEPGIQKQVFKEHLNIAAELNLPVIIHSRQAFDETMEILSPFQGKLKNLVFHCFGGNAQEAQIVLAHGFYISFTGVITFKNAQSARDAVAAVPLDRMMAETDCPYMAPEPMRKQKVNEPALMIHTVKKIAEIKGVRLDVAAASLTSTTKSFFGINSQS
jgi:TatD DNase family protein